MSICEASFIFKVENCFPHFCIVSTEDYMELQGVHFVCAYPFVWLVPVSNTGRNKSEKRNMQLPSNKGWFDQLGPLQSFVWVCMISAHNILCAGDTGTLKQDFLVSTCYLCVKYLIFGILCIGFQKSINYNVSFFQIQIQHP